MADAPSPAAASPAAAAASPAPTVPAAAPARPRKKPFLLRPWVRAIHRDAGYFVVGLTFVYALSGLAVNHIADWDPSFRQIEQRHRLTTPLPAEPEAIATRVTAELAVKEAPREVYEAAPGQVDLVFDRRTLHVTVATGEVLEEGQSPRWFLRAANWLHLNRGKKAWTYVADGYAVLLLYLAVSGLFMIPGRKGLVGRGAVIALLGAAVPIGYVVWSGGPEAKSGSARPNP